MFRRIACTNARIISTRAAIRGNNIASSSRPIVVKTWATDVTRHALAVRYVSEEARNKVNIRKEAVRRTSTIEDRVKKIVAEQLGVKEEEVRTQSCACYTFRLAEITPRVSIIQQHY